MPTPEQQLPNTVRHPQPRPGQAKTNHDVMIRPNKELHRQLAAIAEQEERKHGPQALQFVKEGVDRYLADNPELARQLQATA